MYDNSTPDSAARAREERHEAERAAAWRYDARMEEALRLKKDHPGDYANLVTPGQKMSLGLYISGREAAKRAGRDVTGGDR